MNNWFAFNFQVLQIEGKFWKIELRFGHSRNFKNMSFVLDVPEKIPFGWQTLLLRAYCFVDLNIVCENALSNWAQPTVLGWREWSNSMVSSFTQLRKGNSVFDIPFRQILTFLFFQSKTAQKVNLWIVHLLASNGSSSLAETFKVILCWQHPKCSFCISRRLHNKRHFRTQNHDVVIFWAVVNCLKWNERNWRLLPQRHDNLIWLKRHLQICVFCGEHLFLKLVCGKWWQPAGMLPHDYQAVQNHSVIPCWDQNTAPNLRRNSMDSGQNCRYSASWHSMPFLLTRTFSQSLLRRCIILFCLPTTLQNDVWPADNTATYFRWHWAHRVHKDLPTRHMTRKSF